MMQMQHAASVGTSTQTVAVSAKDLAVNGREKAIKAFETEQDTWGLKVGVDELVVLVDTWGYSKEAQERVREILEPEDENVNPHLARYYDPRPSRVDMFEQYARDVFGAKYALGVNSGTSALMAAYVASGIGPGTEVIIPAHTFYATVAAVVAAKGIPVIAEIDESYTIILIAESREAATKLVDALVAEGVPAGTRGTRTSRDWHIYSYWEQILEQKTPTSEGCPFTCPYYEGPLPDYAEDMCARSAELFDRVVHVRVNQWWTERDCEKVASAINKVCWVYS